MRFRITVRPTGDRAGDLLVAASVRRALWASSRVGIDPDNPLRGTHRDGDGSAYFEFFTDFTEDEACRVLTASGHADRVNLRRVEGPLGPACQNCGNIVGPVLPTVCPNCHFRDVSACPACHEETPRQSYRPIGGDLFRCPSCHDKVRLRFNDPMFLDDGAYNQPLIVVEQMENHEVQV